MSNEEWIKEELAAIREQALERRTLAYSEVGGKCRVGDREVLNFSSNDYLDFARDPRIVAGAAAALVGVGAGSTASRLMTGTLSCHEELEKRLADFKGYPSALVFGSGFLANAGVIPTLVGKDDSVFADKLVHASIIDAVTLSRATLRRFRHNDPEHLDALLQKAPAAGKRLVVTESVFSMDGDLAPLQALTEAATRHGAMLMVDEAHATGVFGPAGSGLIRAHGLESSAHVSMATLSKAMGSYGGFVACSPDLRELLVNRARSFIYTTALPPAAVGAALAALDTLEKDPDMGSRLLGNAAFFRDALRDAGFDTGHSESQIIPVMVGENEKTLALSKRLGESGILAVAVRPPTVPVGSARIRFSVTLAHTRDDLEQAVSTITAAAQAEDML